MSADGTVSYRKLLCVNAQLCGVAVCLAGWALPRKSVALLVPEEQRGSIHSCHQLRALTAAHGRGSLCHGVQTFWWKYAGCSYRGQDLMFGPTLSGSNLHEDGWGQG